MADAGKEVSFVYSHALSQLTLVWKCISQTYEGWILEQRKTIPENKQRK